MLWSKMKLQQTREHDKGAPGTIRGTDAAGTDLKQALHEGDAVGQAGLLCTQDPRAYRHPAELLGLQPGHGAAQLPKLQPA